MQFMRLQIDAGIPDPLGSTIDSTGVNFALFSEHAEQIWLCIEAKSQSIEIPLDPKKNRTGNIWHIFVYDLPLPCSYAYRVDGSQSLPYLYQRENLLLDPYAKKLDTSEKWGHSSYQSKGVLQKAQDFDWQGVCSPNLDRKDWIIYEMHVRGFTQDSSSKVQHPGTFLGMIEKIPYLKKLGVTAVELMPIHEFNEGAYQTIDPITQEKLCNFWGYSSIHFFSPMNRYATDSEKTIKECKTLVRELHREKIEVVLDVVFNHTAENDTEKRYSFMGIDRSVYYLLHEGKHTNYTGCGHTINLNHPAMQNLVLDCLKYWVQEMHIDGFRFDLASIMHRDSDGKLGIGEIVQKVSEDPILKNTKLIAEPWDLGAFQLGKFAPSQNRWSEWNGYYRDAVRKFIRSDGNKKEFADCLIGSPSLFAKQSPQASVNFITCHDGFTLRDLVSYDQKHNERNGEDNRDGNPYNLSWNCGVEGPTEGASIESLRQKQMKNFIVALFVSQGIPMLLMGDEYGHTKEGNNNTWCQDNALSWFQWNWKSSLPTLIQRLIRFRKSHPVFQKNSFIEPKWHGRKLNQPEWEIQESVLACSLDSDVYIAFNLSEKEVKFELPKLHSLKFWNVIVSTGNKDIKISDTVILEPFSSLLMQMKSSK